MARDRARYPALALAGALAAAAAAGPARAPSRRVHAPHPRNRARMQFSALDADALARIVAWVLRIGRADAEARAVAIRSEPYPELLICFDDVVFVALTCKPLYEAMVSVLEQQRAALAAAYGVGLPSAPPSAPAERPERSGLIVLDDPAQWKRPKLTTSIAGVFVSPQRYVYATERFAGIHYDPGARRSTVARPCSLWDRLHANPCGTGSLATLRFLEVACARDARDLARKEAFAGHRLSEMAVSAMLRVAPLTMILGSFPEILSEHPRRCGLDLNERHHQLLVAYAAFWGRTDVLDRLLHSNPRACRAYDKPRGLISTIREELMYESAGGTVMTNLHVWVVDPAVANDRSDVLDWLTQVREDLERQQCPLSPLPYRFATPEHPYFMEAAWLAARRGAVSALDWLFDQAAPTVRVGYGEHPFEITVAALGILVLAFGGGRCGDTSGQRFGHRVARDGLQAVGASARWAQTTWHLHAQNFYADVEHNSEFVALVDDDEPQLPTTAAERRSFLGFVALINCSALRSTIHRRAEHDAAWTLGEWLLSRSALRHFARQALVDVGDADRARWLIEESAPGGFLHSIAPTPELDDAQCDRVSHLLRGLSVPPALALKALRAELRRLAAEHGVLGGAAQPVVFRERCTGRDALLQTALLMALQNQSGTHLTHVGAYSESCVPWLTQEPIVAVDRVDARRTIRSNASSALLHGAEQWGSHGVATNRADLVPALSVSAAASQWWLHCPGVFGNLSLAARHGLHELRGVTSADVASGLLMGAYVESVIVGPEPRPAPLDVADKCKLLNPACFFPYPNERLGLDLLPISSSSAQVFRRIGLHKNLRGPLLRLRSRLRALPGSRPEDGPLGDALQALCASDDLSTQAW
jgi:hypothetical protein